MAMTTVIATIDTSPLLDNEVHGHDTTDDYETAAHIEINNFNSIHSNRIDDSETTHAIHPPTWRRPFSSTVIYFSELSGFFSWRFLSWLAICNCCVGGGAFSLVMSLGLPLFKELGIDASRQQLYMSMIMSPWAMKPFIGVASDLFTIRGYNKRYFALYSILIGLLGSTTLLGFYHSRTEESAISQGNDNIGQLADMIVICFTALSYEAATLDILGEGKYAEIMHLHPESGSSIVSFKFGCSLLGGIITQLYVGPLTDAGYFRVLFWIAIVLSLTPLYPTIVGWIPEKMRTGNEPGMAKLCKGCLFDRGTFEERKTPIIIITLCGLSAPILAAVTTYTNLEIGLAVAAALISAFVVATYYSFPRTFFWVFLSFVLTSLSWISIGSALGYYYTASNECVPNGPNFDYTFYITVTGVIGSIMNFVAVILYQTFLSSWRFRPVLISTVVVGSLASIVDLIIVKRWNIAIGIPDKVFFVFGNTIFEKLVIMMQYIPMSSIYAKIAPPGMESAMFAYTAGITSFCSMMSTLLGSGVIRWSGMRTVGDSCDFDVLPYLIVIFQICVPLAVRIPAIFLIPNVSQTEHLIDWKKEGWYAESTEAEATEQVTNVVDVNDDDGETNRDPRFEPHYLL